MCASRESIGADFWCRATFPPSNLSFRSVNLCRATSTCAKWVVCGQIRLGCAHLEEALALLDQAGLTGGMSKLAVEIQEGLRQLKPDCLIEHLKVRSGGA